MPRYSKRMLFLRRSKELLKKRQRLQQLRFLLDMEDEFQDDMDSMAAMQFKGHSKARYLFRACYKSRDAKRTNKVDKTLHTEKFTPTEFKEHFRVSREMFWAIHERISDDVEFVSVSPVKRKRGSSELHLLVLLKFLGSNGNEATPSKLGQFFKMSKGSFLSYRDRMVVVLLKHLDDTVFWPEADERKEIAKRIEEKYLFPNCVGFPDGTLLPLELKPSLNGEDSFSRKSCYAVNTLITCDDICRIRDVVIGWPGSVHDNRVWKTSAMYAKRESCFSPKEYLLGDSAFGASRVMIPAFKKPRGARFARIQEVFNTYLAKPRVKAEHCIGIFKGRFQYFKRMRVLICSKKDLKRTVEQFQCACILHNWLLSEPDCLNWIESESEDEDDDDDSDNNANDAVVDTVEGTERRTALLTYIMEKINM